MSRLLRIILLFFVAAGVCLPAAALDLQRRRMLTAAEQVPWRAVGRVNIEIRSSAVAMCTGTLIAEDLVLTAAHCVVSPLTGLPQTPGNVHFVAGWRMGSWIAHSKAAKIAVHPRYQGGRTSVLANVPFDLALIRLATPIPRAKVPFFPVAPARKDKLTLVSYRQDRKYALTRQDGCTISMIKGAVLTLGCEVTFGASGSPLFQQIGGETRVVAVLSAMRRQNGRTIASAVSVEAALADVLAALN